MDKKSSLIVDADPKSPAAEAFRILRTNIQFCSPDTRLHTVMLTSAGPGEGKSTVAANLAVTMAQAEENVILVDADLRRGLLHRTLGLSNAVGLTNVLMGKADLDRALQSTKIENLRVLTTGPLPPNPAELLGSKAMDRVIMELQERASFIIFDAPPALVVTDAPLIATRVDGTILVMDSGSVPREVALKTKASLEGVKAKILGVVLNNMPISESYYYYYYYYSSEGKAEKH